MSPTTKQLEPVHEITISESSNYPSDPSTLTTGSIPITPAASGLVIHEDPGSYVRHVSTSVDDEYGNTNPGWWEKRKSKWGMGIMKRPSDITVNQREKGEYAPCHCRTG